MKRNNINQSIYIGDTKNDYLSAIKSNNKFIWAKYGFGEDNNYENTINDISDLLYLFN